MCKNACMSIQREIGVVPEITTGDRLRISLRHASIAVQEMAEYLGVSRTSVSNWLGDRVQPSKQTLRLWAFRCGVPLVWLETGQAPTEPSGPEGSYTTWDSNPEPIDKSSNVRVLRRRSASGHRPAA